MVAEPSRPSSAAKVGPRSSRGLNALNLKPGDRVLEIGAGPGFVSFALADRVGPTGVVYALDRSADALADLERRQKERGIGHIQRIAADAATLQPDGVQAGSALITMVLHHADHPAEILRNVSDLRQSPEHYFLVAQRGH